jgi:hypothetical protein
MFLRTQDTPQQSEKLVSKYMQDPHTLVLLVTPAYEKLNTNRAAQLVQQFKKEENTIGVLTMVDKAVDNRFPNDPYFEVKKKLNGESFDYIHLGSKGYVAVKVSVLHIQSTYV